MVKRILFLLMLLMPFCNLSFAYSWDELRYVTNDGRFSYYVPNYKPNTVTIPFPGAYNHEAIEYDFVVSDSIAVYQEHRILVTKDVATDKWIYTRVFSVYKAGGKTHTEVYYVQVWNPLDFSDVVGQCVKNVIEHNKKIFT